MKYDFIRWKDGDQLTCDKLNRMENAVANFDKRSIIITGEINDSYFVLNTTYTDIKNAFMAGKNVIIDMTPRDGSYLKVDYIDRYGLYCNNVYFFLNESGYPLIFAEED